MSCQSQLALCFLNLDSLYVVLVTSFMLFLSSFVIQFSLFFFKVLEILLIVGLISLTKIFLLIVGLIGFV